MKLKSGDIANFIEFLDKTPTPFHVFSELSEALAREKCERITLSDVQNAKRGKSYFVTFGDTALAAFRAGKDEAVKGSGGMFIAAAHGDYPVFKIKNTGVRKGSGVLRINVEMYGGAIVHPWMDRPLKAAGRVFISHEGQLLHADLLDLGVRFVIPNAALHMNRSVNDGARFSVQNQLLPFLGLDNDAGEDAFADLIAAKAGEALGITGVTGADIMSFDLSLVVAEGASLYGASDELILAQGLDDRAMIHAIFTGFCANAKKAAPEGSDVKIAFAFNHEECGSETDVGANSAFVRELVKALSSRFFPEEHCLDVSQRSLILSSDMGHATHPSYPEFSDATSPVVLGKGVVLKTSWNQSYSTAAGPMADFACFCKENNVPFQRFTNNSDARGGGTIGPKLAASLGMKTCDIGTPLLAMHSPKETGAVSDHLAAEEMFLKFFG